MAVPWCQDRQRESDQLEPRIGTRISSYLGLVASTNPELNTKSSWQSRYHCQMQLLHRNIPNSGKWGLHRSSALDQVEHTTLDHIRLTTNHNEHLTSLDLSITYCSISDVIRCSIYSNVVIRHDTGTGFNSHTHSPRTACRLCHHSKRSEKRNWPSLQASAPVINTAFNKFLLFCS